MAERLLFFTSLIPAMLEADEHASMQYILPPNASEVALHLLDVEKYSFHELEVHPACLGALVIATVRLLPKSGESQRILGGLSFKSTCDDVATSPKEFRELKRDHKGTPL